MKLIKKAAAAAMAAAITLSLSAVGANAQSSENGQKIYIESEKASVGDTAKVTVKIDTAKGLSSVDFVLKFDTESLELVADSIVTKKPIENWVPIVSNAAGSIVYGGYILDGSGFSSNNTDILEVSFKVLKPNAELILDSLLICGDDSENSYITNEFTVNNGTIECSHKNTETKTTPSTCTVKGKEETVCKDCGAVVETKELPLAEHKWDEGTETKAATCTEKGEKTYNCTVCGETKTEEIPALGHDYVEDKDASKAPTCDADGETVSKCSRCGDEKKESVPATGHSYGEWKTTKDATESEEGLKERVCSVCGNKETLTIPVKTGDENYETGVELALLPLIAAGAAVIVLGKKRR